MKPLAPLTASFLTCGLITMSAQASALSLVDALNLGNPGQDVAVVFSQPVDPATATVTANYAINGGVTITGARIAASPDTVLLTTAGALEPSPRKTVTVNNVKDQASPTDVIDPNSTIRVEEDLNTWFRLDESSGTVATDSSGNGNNGTMFNDATPGYEGKVFRALNFAGLTGGYVQFKTGFADFTTNGLTVALWVYPTVEGGAATWDRFIDFANGPANDNILFARTGGGQSVTFEVYSGGVSGGKVTSPDGTLLVNQWQHFAATMDPSGYVTIYRNGIEITNGYTAVPALITRTRNYLGRSNWAGDDYYAGKMDDVRIYDRVLDPAAILALANGGGPDDTDPSIPVVSVTATTPNTALRDTVPGVFTITRAGDTGADLTVQYSLSGTALNFANYAGLSGSAVIPSGANSVQVQVTPIDLSFQDLSRTVILNLTPNASYSVGEPTFDTVTIQNNDVAAAAVSATADNPVGSVSNATIDVWFAAPVTDPSATTLANYTLGSAPGLSLTSATLLNGNLRVVLDVSGPVPTNATLSVSGVLDAGGNTSPSQLPLFVRLAPVNLVADTYHSPNDRPSCFALATDGIANGTDNAAGFDTWSGGGQPSEFVGLLYPFSEDFHSIKVNLGNQFPDGGSWLSEPKVYILKHPIDTNQTRPENDTNDWLQVPAKLLSPAKFQATMDPNAPDTPIVFDLSGVPASDRTGYGWAIGGVKGNGANDFISISEVGAYGVQGANRAFVITQQPSNLTVTEGQVATFRAQIRNSLAPLAFQWQENGTDIPDATNISYSIRPVMMTDNNSQFDVVISTVPPVASLASQTATLTVLARTNPPVVLDAVYDPSNMVINVWFDEAVDPNSAFTSEDYQINDPNLTYYVQNLDAQSRRVALSLSGAPSVANPTVTVKNILDTFGNMIGSQTVPLLFLSTGPTHVVANQYQQGRDAAFTRSTDGMVQNDANLTTWTTFGGAPGLSDFAGVTYSQPQAFGLVRVDLGWQFVDGGDWAYPPRVFILKSPIDTNQTPPEDDPVDWLEVPAQLISGNIFTLAPDSPTGTVPLPNSPIAFDLSQLPLSQRVGYGWAVGGVQGNGPNAQFVSIAELSGFGTPASSLTNIPGAPQLVLDVAPTNQTLPAGFPLSYSAVATGTQPLSYQWLFNGAPLADTVRISGAQSATLSFSQTQLSDSGAYQVVVSNSLGIARSSVANLHLTGVAFNTGGGWTPNGNATFANNSLTLVHGNTGEASAAFLDYPLDISKFTATWTYQDIGGGGADGTVFVLQNDPRGPQALGGGGGSLGYSGIFPSLALEMNVYGPNSPGIVLDTDGTAGPAPYWTTAPVNVAGGDPIAVRLQYDGATLSLTLTDTANNASFSTNWVEDVPTAVGGTNMAYVGFTGASGGVASHQVVSNFSFTSGLTVSLSLEFTAQNSILISWPVTGENYVLQETPSLSQPNWSNVTDTINIVGGQAQVEVSPTAGARFYRLQLQ